ncbi:hypothetical protein ZHAS_00019905 [Anopheles sinensis]|uniref:Uncharacterized protein n=1 Tax=Anopheles sinensis TaxID=74873 RepID=A0A084WMI2_ANOSI|nr:hypothetical protein ZHAS_00019905 [Anopheles sinensis]
MADKFVEPPNPVSCQFGCSCGRTGSEKGRLSIKRGYMRVSVRERKSILASLLYNSYKSFFHIGSHFSTYFFLVRSSYETAIATNVVRSFEPTMPAFSRIGPRTASDRQNVLNLIKKVQRQQQRKPAETAPHTIPRPGAFLEAIGEMRGEREDGLVW